MVLSAQPWDWIAPLVHAVGQWLNSDSIRQLPANAGLFLITGGLSILTLIVSLVFLQSILPVRNPTPMFGQNLPAERELRPLRAPGQGRVVPIVSADKKRSLNYHPVDQVLESLVAGGIGEPRLLDHYARMTHVRLFLCPSCRDGAATQQHACARERMAVEGAFQTYFHRPVNVVEVSCKLRGQPECDFEVRH